MSSGEDDDQAGSKQLRAESEAETSFRKMNPLQKHVVKKKITGKGVKMIEKIAYLLMEEDENPEKTSFLQVRLVGPKASRRAPKTQKKNCSRVESSIDGKAIISDDLPCLIL